MVVTAPEEIRLERLLRRDQIPAEKIRERMAAQFPRAYYEARADMIIRNYPPFPLEKELERLHQKIEEALM